jgi:hypothetical protein
MRDPLSAEQATALNHDVHERITVELGTLMQKVILLQAQNAFLLRELERLTDGRSPAG